MNCTICGKPVVLRPSASERAAKVGGTAAYYTSLFPNHADCEIAQRHKPVKPTPIKDMPAIFQEEEMGRLRRLACKAFGIDAGSKQTADYVNTLDETALRALL